jgi:hypothetical protein
VALEEEDAGVEGCWGGVEGVDAAGVDEDEDADEGAGSDSDGREPQAKNRKKQEISTKQKTLFFINNSLLLCPLYQILSLKSKKNKC